MNHVISEVVWSSAEKANTLLVKLSEEDTAKLAQTHTMFAVTFLVNQELRKSRMWIETSHFQKFPDTVQKQCIMDFRSAFEKVSCPNDVDAKMHFLEATMIFSKGDPKVFIGANLHTGLSHDFSMTEDMLEKEIQEKNQKVLAEIIGIYKESGIRTINRFSNRAVNIALLALHRFEKRPVEEIAFLDKLMPEETIQMVFDILGKFAEGLRNSEDEIEDFVLGVLTAFEAQRTETSTPSAE